jgi:hypothetical protein
MPRNKLTTKHATNLATQGAEQNIGLFFDLEDGCVMFLRNFGLSSNYTALEPKTSYCSFVTLCVSYSVKKLNSYSKSANIYVYT